MKNRILKVFFGLSIIVCCAFAQDPCVPRDMGYSSFVCVCNSTYCDSMGVAEAPSEDQFLVVSSNIQSKRFEKNVYSFNKISKKLEETSDVKLEATFLLDETQRFQTMHGWGTSFTDSATINLKLLSHETQENLLRSYFTSSGLDYNMGRVNIGGCDFSVRGYTYLDTEDDTDLNTWALEEEDITYKIPTIERAKEMSSRDIKLVASAWTAPGWMKSNGDLIGYGKLKEEMYGPWAEYHLRFFESYKDLGIDFWGLTPQNEPLDGYIPGFPFNCMGWTAEQQRTWIKNDLGPLLQERGFSDLNLMIHDDQRPELPGRAAKILEDEYVNSIVSGIAVHWYADDVGNPDRLTQTHEMFPDKFILNTEACEGDGPLQIKVMPGEWKRLESYASDIIEDVEHWVTGWIDWNFCLDLQGGPNWSNNFVDSPILINEESDEFYKNPMYYAMGHFSKFATEGAVRISLTSDNAQGLEYTAFKNTDGSTALIFLNRFHENVTVYIQIEGKGLMEFEVEERSIHSVLFK